MKQGLSWREFQQAYREEHPKPEGKEEARQLMKEMGRAWRAYKEKGLHEAVEEGNDETEPEDQPVEAEDAASVDESAPAHGDIVGADADIGVSDDREAAETGEVVYEFQSEAEASPDSEGGGSASRADSGEVRSYGEAEKKVTEQDREAQGLGFDTAHDWYKHVADSIHQAGNNFLRLATHGECEVREPEMRRLNECGAYILRKYDRDGKLAENAPEVAYILTLADVATQVYLYRREQQEREKPRESEEKTEKPRDSGRVDPAIPRSDEVAR